MAKKVRYTQPLFGEANAAGYLILVPGASVLIRQDGVACDVFADNDGAAMTNPVPTGVAVGAAGVDVNGTLLVYLEPGSGYDGEATVGAAISTFSIPDIAPVHSDLWWDVREWGTLAANAGVNAATIQAAMNDSGIYPPGHQVRLPRGQWPCDPFSFRAGAVFRGVGRHVSLLLGQPDAEYVGLYDESVGDPPVPGGPAEISDIGFLPGGGGVMPAALKVMAPDFVVRSIWSTGLPLWYQNASNCRFFDVDIEQVDGIGILMDACYEVRGFGSQVFHCTGDGLVVRNGSKGCSYQGALMRNEGHGALISGSKVCKVIALAVDNSYDAAGTYDAVGFVAAEQCEAWLQIHKEDATVYTRRSASLDAASVKNYVFVKGLADELTAGALAPLDTGTDNTWDDGNVTTRSDIRAAFLRTPGNEAVISYEGTGGKVEVAVSNAQMANPGAFRAKEYYRLGTNPNTLKKVVIAGESGAETVILDNIPMT